MTTDSLNYLMKHKKLKLDGETEKFFKGIKNREKSVDKKEFMKYFSYKPTTLVNNLWSQNTKFKKKFGWD